MHRKFGSLAIGALLLGVAASASAQDGLPRGLSLRLGLFVPTDDDTRIGNSGWFAAGVDHRLTERVTDQGNRQWLTLSLDYTARDNFRTVPLMVNIVHFTGPFYVTAGLGAAFTRYPVFGGVEDRTRFAYQIGAGYEFSTSQFPLFVEAKFLGNQRVEMNGVGMYVGVRF